MRSRYDTHGALYRDYRNYITTVENTLNNNIYAFNIGPLKLWSNWKCIGEEKNHNQVIELRRTEMRDQMLIQVIQVDYTWTF